MNTTDVKGFFASPEQLEMADYLTLEYYVECVGDIEIALAHFCSEQSTAQWSRIGYDEDFRVQFGAKVINLQILGEREQLSYPVTHSEQGAIHACRVTIAHPHRNFGPKLPNLLTAVCGEGVFFTPGVPIVKLLDISFPESYLQEFDGPKFGSRVSAIFFRLMIARIFFGVVKPNIGLSPGTFCPDC